MNILLCDGLPEDYKGIPISPDFRNMLHVDLILRDPDASEVEKTIAALYQLYPEIPQDTGMAVDGLMWFYSRGKFGEKQDGKAPKKAEKKAFDFEQDASLIYAAFYATYNISLTTVDFLHWWEFMALFEGLPETTLIQRVMYWRTADLTGMSKSERKHVSKMRQLFALEEPAKEALSVEELNQQTKDRVARRFREAQAALEEGRTKNNEQP